jgi:hypothetical protein
MEIQLSPASSSSLLHPIKYSITPFIPNNWDRKPSRYAEIRINFSLKIGYIGSSKWKKFLQTAIFRLHVYLPTNKTLIHNSLYIFDKGEKSKP